MAGREARALAAAALFLAFWAGLAMLIALSEPSLGLRFSPDPAGGGVLAYAPDRAVKVHTREEALQRYVALRPQGSQGEGMRLDGLVAEEAPSMLPRQEDLDRFFVLQAQTWDILAAARDAGSRVEMQRPDGGWDSFAVHPRGWNELGLLFWVPLLCAVIPFVVGVGVGVYRWQSVGARYLALASVMTLLALAEVSIITGRLWLVPPWFAWPSQVWVRLTSLGAVYAFAMMVLHYPTPMRGARAWQRAATALLAVLFVLNALEWPAHQALRYKLWLAVGGIAVLLLGVGQCFRRRNDPVHRAAARWMGASVVLAFSIVQYSFAISLVYDAPAISNSYRWVSMPLLYLGLVLSVGRANLFELERWWVPLCLWWLGGTMVVLTDLTLVGLLHVNSGAAITLSLLAMGWLYFPLRQWMLSRLRLGNTPRVAAYVPDLIGAVNAGLAGAAAASQAWRQLLERVFEPLQIQAVGGSQGDSTRVLDGGRRMHVPDVDGRQVWQLTLAQRGRHLFTEGHAEVAAHLWQLLDLGLQQQRRAQSAVEQERQRIAADLHDDMGARLLTITQASDSPRVSQLARQALDEMRLAVRGLSSVAAPALNILADWRAESVTRVAAAGLQPEWIADEPPADLLLPSRLHVQLTRVLREAVSNAIRHSDARRVRVRIAFAQGQLCLDVEDDGRGLATAERQAAPGGGHGMPGIERRVRGLRGQHRYETPAGGGTRLVVQIPLAGQGIDPP